MYKWKIDKTIESLKLASEMSKEFYNKPLIIAYSGGKDSDVLLDIARKCLKPDEFEVVNSHTSVDAPETVYHIREVFKDVRGGGYEVHSTYPERQGRKTDYYVESDTKEENATYKISSLLLCDSQGNINT